MGYLFRKYVTLETIDKETGEIVHREQSIAKESKSFLELMGHTVVTQDFHHEPSVSDAKAVDSSSDNSSDNSPSRVVPLHDDVTVPNEPVSDITEQDTAPMFEDIDTSDIEAIQSDNDEVVENDASDDSEDATEDIITPDDLDTDDSESFDIADLDFSDVGDSAQDTDNASETTDSPEDTTPDVEEATDSHVENNNVTVADEDLPEYPSEEESGKWDDLDLLF